MTAPADLRALLVEDDPLRARALTRQLRSRGYGVVWVATAPNALRELLIARFDLISLDYQIEEGTGVDVAKWIIDLPRDQRPVSVEVHSSDDEGALQILGLLIEANVPAFRKEIA